MPLPSPRSPRELDERILARARAAAPQQHRRGPLAWAGGLATAAVLVVAVYLLRLSDTATLTPAPASDPVQEEEAAGAPATAEIAPAANQADPQQKLKMSAARPAADFAAQAPAAERAEAAAAAPAAGDETPGPDINAELLRLQALEAAGKREQALREYAELRRRCADCALPQTLEQALAQLPREQQ
ncbi:hypothetical protein DWB85_08770 [Seongchinamella sediminis]|uniref:Uncharacterized protein n=1 Tax=Seongchinamella sediminis TaxID=2283635 RepID=A0A3L7E0V7_9GAMM|nr:hypothetical protein DWB85_08770 [Seongchinamella sediminis]